MRRKPVLTIFYQFDPWRSTIGGIQTLTLAFIKYAPAAFDLRLVGISSTPELTLGRWHDTEVEGRALHFMPLLYIENDDVRHLIPTTLRYTLALAGRNLASDFMHFHRLEPTLATAHWSGDKTLFIHNDIHRQMGIEGDRKAILWRYFPQAYYALEGLLVSQFTQILSCNSESMMCYRQRYPAIAERVHYFRNAFDPGMFFPLPLPDRDVARMALARKLGLSEATRFILFAGRLHPQKDPLLLIRAIAALNDPTAHLLIAGEGELATAVRAEIAALGLTARVTLMGAVKRADMAALHQVSQVCVLTSAYEGLPIVVLEALACGTPMVTTRTGETPYILTPESGLVSEARTPVAIAQALRHVLQQPERYPADACVKVAQPYSAQTVITNVYMDMLERWENRVFSMTAA